MKSVSHIVAFLRSRNVRLAGSVVVLVTVAAAASAVAVHAMSSAPAAQGKRHAAVAPAPRRHRASGAFERTPGASEFATVVVDTTSAYAEAHGEAIRITNVHCVEAAPGRYMCSYRVARPGRPGECHLMQATWTPGRASTYTVTLGGRVRRCATLRDALRSLG